MSAGLVKTAQECWDQFVVAGVLRPKDYDADLVDELRERLNLNRAVEFRASMSGLSAQALIEGIFAVLEPVVAMMTDLLRLYETIGATQASDPNLKVEFNFDPDAEPLVFDLSAFREWETRFRRTLVTRRFWNWRQRPAWELVRVIRQGVSELSPDSTFHWEPTMEWPPSGQSAPVSGIDDLDLRIARAWQVREDFLTDVVSRWPKRADYRTAFHDPDRDADEARIMVSDFWDQAMGDELRQLAASSASALAQGAPPELVPAAITTLTDGMDNALAELPTIERQVQENIKELISLLSLPMWGKRHELYSAWIFTRIVDAIGHERLSFSVKSGQLSFDFRGVELATFASVDGPFAVWTELRTTYENPVGHGRTSGIQPDYRIVQEPIHMPESSILAVEVKQYLKSALRNPADALADYTGGLPRAHVVLTTYGPVSVRVKDSLKPGARERAHVIHHMRPGYVDQLEEFRTVISTWIPAGPPPMPRSAADRRVLDRERGSDVRVELTWELLGADLDLHGLLSDGQVVNFQNQQAESQAGSVRLEEDIRDAPGPEILHISGEDVVTVDVHAYTHHDLGAVGAKLRLICGPLDQTISLAPSRDDRVARMCRALIVTPDKIQIIEHYSSLPTAP